MKVEKVMINGKGYYRFRNCENIKNLCARCCFSKGDRCDLPFPCKGKSYYVRSKNCPVKIANATINVDLPTPPEEHFGEEGKVDSKAKIGKRSYYGFPNGVEAEDICRYLPFNLGNVVKYSCRAGRKDKAKKIEDLEKARDYLEDEIKRAKEELGNEIQGMKEKIAKENEGR